MKIHKQAIVLIEKHAKEAGKSPKDYCEDALSEMFGDSQLVDILRTGGGCPIEAFGALITEGAKQDTEQ